MKNKALIIVGVLLVCFTFIACAMIIVKPNILFRKSSGITVKGYAVQRVVSDVARWTIVLSDSKLMLEATDRNIFADIENKSKKLVANLEKLGFKKAEINVGAIGVNDIMRKDKNGYDTNEVYAKSVNVTVSVTTGNLKLLESVVNNIASFCDNSLNINVEQPLYFYSKIEDIKLDLLAKATENARERAMTLAKSGGAKLGNIISANQGIFQVTQPLSTDTASWGIYETGTIEKDVKCVVNAEFAIEK
jgi:hypothetical protein